MDEAEPPAWATFCDAELAADLDGDGACEAILLRGRRLVVRAGSAGADGGLAGAGGPADTDGALAVEGTAGSGVLFETPPDWLVSDAFAADFDGDGAVELAFLLWKHGNYGPARPFWVDAAEDGPARGDASAEDAREQQARVRTLLRTRAGASTQFGDEGLTQHLFVYRWRPDGRLHPVWMSSRLGLDITHIELVEAVGAEASREKAGPARAGTFGPRSRPHLRITSASGRVTRWAWLSWGFALIEEGAPDATAARASGGSTLAAAPCVPAALAAASPKHPLRPAVASAAGSAAAPTATLTLLAVGDNIAHANVYEGAYDRATRTFDFAPLYEHVRGRIGAHDVAAVCQETILVANPARRSSFPRFATPQSMGDALADAGFTVVLGATNHAADQGPRAIEETCAFWAREHPEVALVGLHARPDEAGRPVFVERGGIRLALFDYTYGLNGGAGLGRSDAWRVDVLDEAGTETLLEGLAVARDEADLTVCFLHVGEEYESEPSAERRALVERAIDAGADVVICSHAHVLGPYGRLRTAAGNDGVVFYGLGNFVSGQCSEARTVLGGAASLRIERPAGAPRARVASYELLPLVCHTDGLGVVAAYFLDDYTNELAAEHILSKLAPCPLTVAALRALVPPELS